MSVQGISIKYDGGDAARHAVDARLLGQSLQGIDRLVSDCIIMFSFQRLPKRGERAPLILKVKEAKVGSYQLPALYQEASQILALGIPIIQAVGPEILSHYVTAVLDFFRGREDATALAISKMAEMHEASLAALTQRQKETLATTRKLDAQNEEYKAAVEANRHEEAMGMQDILRIAISSSGPAAVDYVAPVGRSVDTASFAAGAGESILITKEDAEAIRDSQKMDWGHIATAVLKTDGFKFHSSGLSIENPEREGYMMADVNDPAFEEEANNYTMAAQKRAHIQVLARKGYKNGKLTKIQILDFVAEVQGSI